MSGYLREHLFWLGDKSSHIVYHFTIQLYLIKKYNSFIVVGYGPLSYCSERRYLNFVFSNISFLKIWKGRTWPSQVVDSKSLAPHCCGSRILSLWGSYPSSLRNVGGSTQEPSSTWNNGRRDTLMSSSNSKAGTWNSPYNLYSM